MNRKVQGLLAALLVFCWIGCSGDDNPTRDAGVDGPVVEAGADLRKDGVKTSDYWLKLVSIYDIESAEAVVIRNNQIIVAGDADQRGRSREVVVMAMDKVGQMLWSKQFGVQGWDTPAALGDVGGKLWLVGRIGQFRGFWRSVGDDGTLGTITQLGAADGDGFAALAPTSSGETVLVGTTKTGSEEDVWAVRLASDGSTIKWSKRYAQSGGTFLEDGNAAVALTSGVLVVGTSVDFSTSNLEGWLLMLDDQGGITWQKTLSGPQLERLYAVAREGDDALVVGATRSQGGGGAD